MKYKTALIGIFVSLIGFVSAHTGEDDFSHHEGMMGMMSGAYGMGWGLFGWIFNLLILSALVLLIVWLIKQVQKK